MTILLLPGTRFDRLPNMKLLTFVFTSDIVVDDSFNQNSPDEVAQASAGAWNKLKPVDGELTDIQESEDDLENVDEAPPDEVVRN